MRKMFCLVVMLLLVAMSTTFCEAGKKSSALEGNIVDAQGKPLANIKIAATKQGDIIKGYERTEAKTNTRGVFVLKGLYPDSLYSLSVVGSNHYNIKDTNINVSAGPSGETKIIKAITLKFTPPSPFKKIGFLIIDSRTGLEWYKPSENELLWCSADKYIKESGFGGGRWRLPTLEELKQLYICNDYNKYMTGSCIDPLFKISNTVWASESCPNPKYMNWPSGSLKGCREDADKFVFMFKVGHISYLPSCHSYEAETLAVRESKSTYGQNN